MGRCYCLLLETSSCKNLTHGLIKTANMELLLLILWQGLTSQRKTVHKAVRGFREGKIFSDLCTSKYTLSSMTGESPAVKCMSIHSPWRGPGGGHGLL